MENRSRYSKNKKKKKRKQAVQRKKKEVEICALSTQCMKTQSKIHTNELLVICVNVLRLF